MPGTTAPSARSPYGDFIAEGKADIFLAYCTGAVVAQRETPALEIVQLPAAFAAGADYGLTVMNEASPAAHRFALFVLSPAGQRILAGHGFTAPNLPQ